MWKVSKPVICGTPQNLGELLEVAVTRLMAKKVSLLFVKTQKSRRETQKDAGKCDTTHSRTRVGDAMLPKTGRVGWVRGGGGWGE